MAFETIGDYEIPQAGTNNYASEVNEILRRFALLSAGSTAGDTLQLIGDYRAPLLNDIRLSINAAGKLSSGVYNGASWDDFEAAEKNILDSHILDAANPHTVTASQVGNSTAQWNADELQGYSISAVAPIDGQSLTWNQTAGNWEASTPAGGDVSGPASSVNDSIAVFDGTTGKIIKDGGALISSLATDANLTTHTGDATIHFTEASIDHLNISNVGTNTHAQIDTHIADSSIHRIINDAGTSATELWSATKISTELALKADSDIDFQYVTDNGALTTNTITIPSTIYTFNASTPSVGEVTFNEENTLRVGTDTGIRLELGRTLASRFYATEPIAKGEVITIPGLYAQGLIACKLARADAYNENWVVGVAGNDAAVGDIVEFIQKGVVEGVDTSLLDIDVPLYFCETPGKLVDVRPEFPCATIIIGTVAYTDAINGVIGVNVSQDQYDVSFDGCIIEKQEISYRVDGGAVYCDVEKLGGGDLPVQLNSNTLLLDCTTGSAPDGKATVELVQGTAQKETLNMVYIDLTAGNAILKTTTTYPAQPYAMVGFYSIHDAATVAAHKPLLSRKTTSSKSHDGRGRTSYMMERSTIDGVKYWSGCEPSAVINTGTIPDTLDITSVAGVVYQNHRQDWPELSILTDGIYVANAAPGSVLEGAFINNLALANEDSQGNVITNGRINWTVFGMMNENTNECRLCVNLPRNTYGGSDSGAYYDYDNYKVTSVSQDTYLTAFLIAHVPADISSGGESITFINPLGESEIVSLLGTPIGVSGGGSQSGSFIPTLQQVTDAGASTINPISVTASGVEAITIGDGSWIGTNSIAGSMYVTSGTNPGDGTHLYLDDAIATLTYSGGSSIDVTSTTASVNSPGVGGSSFSVSDAIATIESGSANIFVNNNADITCTNVLADYAGGGNGLVITKDILTNIVGDYLPLSGGTLTDSLTISNGGLSVQENQAGGYAAHIKNDNATGRGLLLDCKGTNQSDAAFWVRYGASLSNGIYMGGDGKLGLGTILPAEEIHLRGTSVAGGKIFTRIENLTADGYSGIEYRNELGNYWQTSISGSTAAINPNGYNLFNSQSGLSLEVDNTGKHTIHATGQILTINDESATGNPLIAFSQDGTRRSYIQHLDSGDNLAFVSEFGGQSWYVGGTESMILDSGGSLGIGGTAEAGIDFQVFGKGGFTDGTAIASYVLNVGSASSGLSIRAGSTSGHLPLAIQNAAATANLLLVDGEGVVKFPSLSTTEADAAGSTVAVTREFSDLISFKKLSSGYIYQSTFGQDLDTLIDSNNYYVVNGTNTPDARNYGYLDVYTSALNYAEQWYRPVATQDGSGYEMWFRSLYNGVWQDWVKYFDENETVVVRKQATYQPNSQGGDIAWSANTDYEYTVTVTGAVVGDSIHVNPDSAIYTAIRTAAVGFDVYGYVSAANTVKINIRTSGYVALGSTDTLRITVI